MTDDKARTAVIAEDFADRFRAYMNTNPDMTGFVIVFLQMPNDIAVAHESTGSMEHWLVGVLTHAIGEFLHDNGAPLTAASESRTPRRRPSSN